MTKTLLYYSTELIVAMNVLKHRASGFSSEVLAVLVFPQTFYDRDCWKRFMRRGRFPDWSLPEEKMALVRFGANSREATLKLYFYVEKPRKLLAAAFLKESS